MEIFVRTHDWASCRYLNCSTQFVILTAFSLSSCMDLPVWKLDGFTITWTFIKWILKASILSNLMLILRNYHLKSLINSLSIHTIGSTLLGHYNLAPPRHIYYGLRNYLQFCIGKCQVEKQKLFALDICWYMRIILCSCFYCTLVSKYCNVH